MMSIGYEHLLIFGSALIATWFVFIYFWPRMLLYVFKRAILVKGFGDGPIPVNTLYTEPQTLFADPLHVPASGSNLMTVGVNHDTLPTVGWLDLRKGPVPSGMTRIASPNDSVLVIGRVLVYSDSDLPTAYSLARQIQLMPLNNERT